jgi:hypothetical protein
MPSTGTTATRPHKAIVFTHFGGLKYTDDFSQNINIIEKQYRTILERYCQSYEQDGNPGLVYVYVDWAYRKIVEAANSPGAPTDGRGAIFDRDKKTFFVDGHVLADELKLFDVLQGQEDEIKSEIQTAGGIPGPRFEYVGIVKLFNLLNSIVDIDPGLIGYLSGNLGKSTYDTPKFVETVIRLARLAVPGLAADPVVRLDEDVTPSVGFFGELLSHYRSKEIFEGFSFFSGRYGDGTDWLNDFAVRTHGFFDPAWDSIPPESPAQTAKYEDAVRAIKIFLSDLVELGAPQFSFADSQPSFSANLERLLTARGHNVFRRLGPQAISGAGLIISYLCVESLPPLMNFNELHVWVDDHFKRRLHEALGNIRHVRPESIAKAICTQKRFDPDRPIRVTEKDVNWYLNDYLYRVLRGCCLLSLVSNVDGSLTRYSELVRDIVGGVVREGDPRVSEAALQKLHLDCRDVTDIRYDDVLQCWQSIEFKEFRVFKWAMDKAVDKTRDLTAQPDRVDLRSKICDQVVNDAIDYLRLLLKWHWIVKAIKQLPKAGNYWLYRPAV